MKKGLISLACLLTLTVTAIPASAQRTRRWNDSRRYEQRIVNSRYRNNVSNGRNNVYTGRTYNGRYWEERSFWDRHRDKLTTAIGAGAGAGIGAMVGGKKGAIIGAIAGGGGAAIYTYGIRDKDNEWRGRRRY